MTIRGPWRRGVFDIQAHAGAQGWFVGDTWAAFRHAIELGSGNVELDVRVSADGVPVVWHDMTLEPGELRCRDERLYGRRIDELPWERLRLVEVGSRTSREHPAQRPVTGQTMLRLDELFVGLTALAPGVWFTVEVKLEPDDARQAARRETALRAVLAAIDAADVRDRVIVHSFDWATLSLAQSLAPDLPRSALASHGETWVPGSPYVGENTFERYGGDLAAAAHGLGVDALAPRFVDQRGRHVVDRAFVDRAHRLGLAVNPWTADATRDLTMLLRAGVDGIVTNHPERLREAAAPLW